MSDHLPFRHPGPDPEPPADAPVVETPNDVPRDLHVAGTPEAAGAAPAAAPPSEADAPEAGDDAGTGAGVIHFDVPVFSGGGGGDGGDDGGGGKAAGSEEDARRIARRERVAEALERTPAQDVASAAADGRTSQSSLLTMPLIEDGHLDALLKLLDQIARPEDADIEINPIIPFARLRTVHFMRLLVHHPSPSDEAPIPEYDGVPQASG
ncbi:MAG TPA: hypothetical protein VGO40_19585, partial [Longimicrobium sp.]|nr:hypothetical protein [Longimicrobium sp.]